MFAISLRKTSIFALTLAFFMLLGGVAQARTSLDGNIRVHNARADSITVRIDGDRVGYVSPGASRLFKRIPNGVRLVQINGPGGAVSVRRVAVPIEDTVQHKVKAIRGTALIRNKSEVTVRVKLDGKTVGTIAPNRSLETKRLRAGRYTLVAKPTSHRFRRVAAQTENLYIKPGTRTEVALAPWYSTVTITNPYEHRVGLFVDGDRIMRLGARETVTLSRQIPGVHTYAMQRRGRVFSRIEMRLNPGRSASWRPAGDRGGFIRVTNNTGGQLEVFVNGRHVTWLVSGEAQMIRGMKPGVHDVAMKTARGRVVEHQRVRVRNAETARVAAYAASSKHRVPSHRQGPAPVAMR